MSQKKNPTDLLTLQISVIYEMRQTDSACQLFIFLTVFKHILCVYWAITGEFPRLHRPWWMVPVFVCVCVLCACGKLKNTYTHFLIDAKYHPPPPQQITDPVSHHKTSLHTTNTDTHFTYTLWFTAVCYYTCYTSFLLSCHGSFLTKNISILLVTHSHLQVAICSASRHATMTKELQGSKLLWLTKLTCWDRQKPLNPSQRWCIGAKYYHKDLLPQSGYTCSDSDHESLR